MNKIELTKTLEEVINSYFNSPKENAANDYQLSHFISSDSDLYHYASV